MNTKLDQFNKLIPNEIKMIFEDAPKDYIDWALVMYLFKHSKFQNKYGVIFDERNVITVGKGYTSEVEQNDIMGFCYIWIL